MKITVYELLGLIKDGKEPDGFICDNIYWYKKAKGSKHYEACNGEKELRYFEIDELNNKVILADKPVEQVIEEKKSYH